MSGKNVTSEYEQLYPRLDKAVEHAVSVSERKIRDQEPDINFRAALALADWRPTHPLEKAAEYFEFDFEFGDEPEDTSIKSNAKVVKYKSFRRGNSWHHNRLTKSMPRMTFSLQTQEVILR